MSTRLTLGITLAAAASLVAPGARAQAPATPPAQSEAPASSESASPAPASVPPANAPAPAQRAPEGPPPVPKPATTPADVDRDRAAQFSTLRLLHDKKVITDAEYQSALRDLGGAMGARAADAETFVFSKWAATLYGFAEGDFMYNSTQSFNDFAGNQQVARPGTYAGEHGRTTFTARDSRFGVRVKMPAPEGFNFTANLEGDFLGSEPGIYQNTGGTAPAPGSTNSEAAYFSNPTFRIRHAFFKAETPYVDFTVGQTWNLLGWQAAYVPAIVQWPGDVGELYGRSVQARLSKTYKLDVVSLDWALAAMRPVQRDSGLPNGEAGLRLSVPKWTGVHTAFLTSTSIMPLSVAVTGDVRAFKVPEFSAAPKTANSETGGAIAVDAYIPIIPGSATHKDNALSVTGEFVTGKGIADQYTAYSTGIANPALPPATPGGTSPAFPSHLDSGLAAYDAAGKLHLIEIRSWFVSGEYYLPGLSGRLGIFGGYYRSEVVNGGDFASAATSVRKHETMIEGGAFVDATQAIRIGADYALIQDTYRDDTTAKNWALQSSMFFFF